MATEWTSIKINVQRHNNNFALLSAAEDPAFKVSFQEVIFCLGKVQLISHKFKSTQQRLEKTLALYPINCVEINTHSIASRSFITVLGKCYTWPNTKQSFCSNE